MIDAIQTLGLTEKEADVYLATLELGTALVSSIAKKAKVNRLTTYSILQSLSRKGYTSHFKKKGTMYFSAVHPQVLLNKSKQNLKTMADTFPQLLAIFNFHQNRPKISFYEGKEGVKTLWNLSLKCEEKKIYQIAHLADLIEIAGKSFVLDYVKRRIEKKIENYLIYEQSGKNVDKSEYNPNKFGSNKKLLRQIRFAPESFHSMGTTFIYDNKVSFMSSQKESFGFLIESNEFSAMMKSFFQTLWSISK